MSQVGEFGSGLDIFNQDPLNQNIKDGTFLHNIALYSNHFGSEFGVRLSSWFWWCW